MGIRMIQLLACTKSIKQMGRSYPGAQHPRDQMTYLQLIISQEAVGASRQLTHPVDPLCTRNKVHPSAQT
eukprot:5006385-Ditylum_brightwellii.AAC.1